MIKLKKYQFGGSFSLYAAPNITPYSPTLSAQSNSSGKTTSTESKDSSKKKDLDWEAFEGTAGANRYLSNEYAQKKMAYEQAIESGNSNLASVIGMELYELKQKGVNAKRFKEGLDANSKEVSGSKDEIAVLNGLVFANNSKNGKVEEISLSDLYADQEKPKEERVYKKLLTKQELGGYYENITDGVRGVEIPFEFANIKSFDAVRDEIIERGMGVGENSIENAPQLLNNVNDKYQKLITNTSTNNAEKITELASYTANQLNLSPADRNALLGQALLTSDRTSKGVLDQYLATIQSLLNPLIDEKESNSLSGLPQDGGNGGFGNFYKEVTIEHSPLTEAAQRGLDPQIAEQIYADNGFLYTGAKIVGKNSEPYYGETLKYIPINSDPMSAGLDRKLSFFGENANMNYNALVQKIGKPVNTATINDLQDRTFRVDGAYVLYMNPDGSPPTEEQTEKNKELNVIRSNYMKALQVRDKFSVNSPTTEEEINQFNSAKAAIPQLEAEVKAAEANGGVTKPFLVHKSGVLLTNDEKDSIEQKETEMIKSANAEIIRLFSDLKLEELAELAPLANANPFKTSFGEETKPLPFQETKTVNFPNEILQLVDVSKNVSTFQSKLNEANVKLKEVEAVIAKSSTDNESRKSRNSLNEQISKLESDLKKAQKQKESLEATMVTDTFLKKLDSFVKANKDIIKDKYEAQTLATLNTIFKLAENTFNMSQASGNFKLVPIAEYGGADKFYGGKIKNAAVGKGGSYTYVFESQTKMEFTSIEAILIAAKETQNAIHKQQGQYVDPDKFKDGGIFKLTKTEFTFKPITLLDI